MGLSLGRVKQIAILVLCVASPVTDSNKEQEQSSWFRIRNKCVRLEQHIYPQRLVGPESETNVSDWNDIYISVDCLVSSEIQLRLLVKYKADIIIIIIEM